ncbi:MAG: hypothetical protein JNN01_24770 [Opitutaceae bacterium]|nr:hypothetical protein [Opitutaceae bacterium]
MFWLLLAVLADFGFVQLFKLGQRRRHAAPVIVAANYLTLGVMVALYLLVTGASAPPAAALALGVGTGVFFISTMLVLNHALTQAPLGAVLTSFRMSILLPVAMGVWIWNEPLSLFQAFGLALAVAALALMPAGGSTQRPGSAPAILGLLVAIFVLQGICNTALRAVHYQGWDAYFLHILMAAGFTGGGLGLGYLRLRNVEPTRPALLFGAGIGIYNAISTPIVLTALSHFPGTTYFPIAGCGIVMLDNLFAHFYWREPLSRTALIGVGVAITSLFVILF